MILRFKDLHGAEFEFGVEDGKFVSPDAASGTVRDLRDAITMHGLADCHAHLTGSDPKDMVTYDGTDIKNKMSRNAILQLEGGVLLIADKGSKTSLSLRFLDEEEAFRPQMQMAGRMIAVAEGYYPDFAIEIDETNLAAVISESVQGGATWVKIVGDWPRRGRGALPNFSGEQLSEIVSVAHAADCRVAIHTAAPGAASAAVRAGVDSIEHGLFLTEQDVGLLGERGGAWVPTVLAMEAVASMLGSGSSGGRLLSEGLDNVARLAAPAIDAGVAVLAGTDVAVPHGQVAKEALRLIEYGLSPAQAVHAVTQAAYDYLGASGGFVEGETADLVVFQTNPVEDPAELLRPALIVRAGRVVLDRVS